MNLDKDDLILLKLLALSESHQMAESAPEAVFERAKAWAAKAMFLVQSEKKAETHYPSEAKEVRVRSKKKTTDY